MPPETDEIPMETSNGRAQSILEKVAAKPVKIESNERVGTVGEKPANDE